MVANGTSQSEQEKVAGSGVASSAQSSNGAGPKVARSGWESASFSLVGIFLQSDAEDRLFTAMAEKGLAAKHIHPLYRAYFTATAMMHHAPGKVVNGQTVANENPTLDEMVLLNAYGLFDTEELGALDTFIQQCVEFGKREEQRQILKKALAQLENPKLSQADAVKAIDDVTTGLMFAHGKRFNVSYTDQLIEIMNSDEIITGVMTGIASFDEAGGLLPDRISALAGRFKGRKTSLANAVITNILADERSTAPILYATFENSGTWSWFAIVAQLATKWLFENGYYDQYWALRLPSGEKRIPLHQITAESLYMGLHSKKYKNWDGRQRQAIEYALGIMRRFEREQSDERRMYFVGKVWGQGGVKRIGDLVPFIKLYQARHKQPVVLVIDHLLVASTQESEYGRLLEAGTDTQAITREFGCMTLALAQLNSAKVDGETTGYSTGVRGGQMLDNIVDDMYRIEYKVEDDDPDDEISVVRKLSRWKPSGLNTLLRYEICPDNGYIVRGKP